MKRSEGFVEQFVGVSDKMPYEPMIPFGVCPQSEACRLNGLFQHRRRSIVERMR